MNSVPWTAVDHHGGRPCLPVCLYKLVLLLEYFMSHTHCLRRGPSTSLDNMDFTSRMIICNQMFGWFLLACTVPETVVAREGRGPVHRVCLSRDYRAPSGSAGHRPVPPGTVRFRHGFPGAAGTGPGHGELVVKWGIVREVVHVSSAYT